ncbi:MAG: Ig-like domain-containing protein, partial [Mycobacterium sp.]
AQARHAAAADGAAGAVLTDAFEITVSDGHGGTVVVPVAVAVAPANTAPGGSASAGAPDGEGRVVGSVSVSDADADPLTFTASTPGKGVVTVNADGTFSYVPTPQARHAAAADGAAGAVLTDAFEITVSDGHGGTVVVPVAVAVAPANAIPTGILSLGEPAANGRLTGVVTAVDADSDGLSYSASAPDRGNVTVNDDGTFSYIPARGKPLLGDAFTITVSDGHGGTVEVPVTVAAPADSAPSEFGGGGGALTVLGVALPTVADVAVTPAAVSPVDIAAPAAATAETAAGSAEAAPAAASAGASETAAPAAAAVAATAAAAPAATAAAAAGASAASAGGQGSSDNGDADGTAAAVAAFKALAAKPNGQQHSAMTSGKSAGKRAGKSAGKPFPSSSEESAQSADPYSPKDPAATLGLVTVLLLAIPLAGASATSASGAAAGTKTGR